MRWLAVLLICLSGPALAEGERAGAFDYYVLALSWTPSWCAYEGDARDSEQCDPGQGFGFTLHGLWPQYEAGWPSYCPTVERAPSRAMTAAEAEIYGTSGLAWHQWRKHGVCTGLPAADYYRLARRAYDSIERPELLRALGREVRLPASVIEEAVLEANPGLGPDMVTVTCQDGRIAELRICLTRGLEPRDCAPDVRRDCTATDALFPPVR
ncbi:ribonuclease T [Rhodobacterales bacterium HKCCE3408]|nr:ribonuclease T [Rhodobacterales bacterium HKCCE3408]